MKIRLTVDGQSMIANLTGSPTTRDFLSLLPITLTLEDYASTEKIAYLPRKLSTEPTTRRGEIWRSSTGTSATRWD